MYSQGMLEHDSFPLKVHFLPGDRPSKYFKPITKIQNVNIINVHVLKYDLHYPVLHIHQKWAGCSTSVLVQVSSQSNDRNMQMYHMARRKI